MLLVDAALPRYSGRAMRRAGSDIIDIREDVTMAQLIVRKLEPEVVAELRKRAARNGRSMEAEHREILRGALGPGRRSRSLKDFLRAMPEAGRDEDFRRRPARPRRVPL